MPTIYTPRSSLSPAWILESWPVLLESRLLLLWEVIFSIKSAMVVVGSSDVVA
jgi:hypothetical protein